MTTIPTLDAIPLLGAALHPLVEGDAADGAFEAFRLDLRPGAASPLHALTAFKVFVVIAGEVVITAGGATAARSAGTAVLVPAGTPHRYVNESGADAAMLVVTSGAGQLAFLRGVSALAAAGPIDRDQMRQHAARHDVVLMPPG